MQTNPNTRLAILVVVLTVVGAAVALITRHIYTAGTGRSSNSANVGSTSATAQSGEQSRQTTPNTNAIGTEEVRQFLQDWKTAWERKDFSAYARFYDERFIGRNYSARSGYISMTRDQWLKDKEQKFRSTSSLSIAIGEPTIEVQDNGVSVLFSQAFQSSSYADQGFKTLHIRRTSNGLRIVSEDFMPRRAAQ